MVTLVWGKMMRLTDGTCIKSHKTNSLAEKPNFSHGVAQRPWAHRAHKKQELCL